MRQSLVVHGESLLVDSVCQLRGKDIRRRWRGERLGSVVS